MLYSFPITELESEATIPKQRTLEDTLKQTCLDLKWYWDSPTSKASFSVSSKEHLTLYQLNLHYKCNEQKFKGQNGRSDAGREIWLIIF